jgi:hypothetical protein
LAKKEYLKAQESNRQFSLDESQYIKKKKKIVSVDQEGDKITRLV